MPDPNPNIGTARVKQGEVLNLNTVASIVCTVYATARVLYDDGTQDLLSVPESATASTRTSEFFTGTQAKADGWVFDAVVQFKNALPKRGQVYVRLGISGQYGPLLCCGYLYLGYKVSMGNFVEPGPAGGDGNIRVIDLTDPAAGADYPAVTVPTGAAWRIRAFNGTLVAAAVAVTRGFTANLSDAVPNVVGLAWASNVQQTTGQTTVYRGGSGFTTPIAFSGNALGVIMMNDEVIPAGYVITPSTTNLQGADNWSQGWMVIEEWLVL